MVVWSLLDWEGKMVVWWHTRMSVLKAKLFMLDVLVLFWTCTITGAVLIKYVYAHYNFCFSQTKLKYICGCD